MHQITFYPLGNADSYRIDLAGGEKLLFDFANVASSDNPDDRRIDLATELRRDLASADRDSYDVVAFTHLDDDHVCGAADFFYLEHTAKCQEGERIKINELWVPASAIVEEGLDGDARVIRAEARYRLKQGKGIRVFSRPTQLQSWFEEQGIDLDSRRHLITDAGKLVPGFSKPTEGVEFFVHSPFASRENGDLIDRNTDALFLQATFAVDSGIDVQFILGADVDHVALTRIVQVTKRHQNEDRLEWDVVKLPHHCSYLSLSNERGKDKTTPVPDVAWLFEEQSNTGGIIVSTSKPIPTNDDDVQPPHRQAANYYRERADAINGEFKVTMEHPSVRHPEPLVIVIDSQGARVKKRHSAGVSHVVSRPSPRVG